MRKQLLFPLFLLWAALTIGQPMSQLFDASGTWTCPPGYVAIVNVEAWGGGGSGGNTPCGDNGGGGGAYSNNLFTVTAGDFVVTVGAGGVNSNGENSDFGHLIPSGFHYFVIATGGSSDGSPGFAFDCIGDIAFDGGNGGNGGNNAGEFVSTGGGGGQSASNGMIGLDGADGLANGTGGAGGGGFISGGGGTGATDGGVDAVPGSVPGGGGGGGACNSGTSQNGGHGRVSVTVVSFLPIYLTSFTATAWEQEKALLSFQTESERNNAFFSIERSRDGENFVEIGKVQGTGTTSATSRYEFIDTKPARGLNYYRLKQTDADGQFSYYKTISLMVAPRQIEVTVLPSSTQQMNFRITSSREEAAEVCLFDLNGRLVHRSTAALMEVVQELNLNLNVSNGLYLLKIITESGYEEVKKVYF